MNTHLLREGKIIPRKRERQKRLAKQPSLVIGTSGLLVQNQEAEALATQKETAAKYLVHRYSADSLQVNERRVTIVLNDQ